MAADNRSRKGYNFSDLSYVVIDACIDVQRQVVRLARLKSERWLLCLELCLQINIFDKPRNDYS